MTPRRAPYLAFAAVFALGVAEAAEPAAPKKMSFVDFVVDHDTVGDQEVEVDGFLMALGDTLIIYERPGSVNGLFVDAEGLSAEEKRALYSKCGSGCKATIVGVAAQVMMNKGMKATRLIRPKPAKAAAQPGAKPAEAPQGLGKPMNVSDYMADYESLSGKHVTVKGYLINMGEASILYERLGSASAVHVDASGLDRETRKMLLAKCSPGCNVEVTGTTGTVLMNKGLIASKIRKK